MKTNFLFFSFFFLTVAGFTQNTKINSLRLAIKKDKPDSNKVIHLGDLGWELMFNDPDTAIIIGKQALFLAKKIQYKKGIANSYSNLGVYNFLKADYPISLDYYQKALKIDVELNNNTGIAKRLGNIGMVYKIQANYPKALDYYFRALKIAEKIGDNYSIAGTLGNIGVIYEVLKDYSKALNYYFKTLKLGEKLGDKNTVAVVLNSIGNVYEGQNNFSKALEYYTRALKVGEELGNKKSIHTSLIDIGIVYAILAKEKPNALQRDSLFSKALGTFFSALKIAKEIGDIEGVTHCLSNIGSLYIQIGKYKEASEYMFRALSLSDSIGIKDGVKNDYQILSDLYEKSTVLLADTLGGKILNKEQMRLRALYYFKKYVSLRDTLFSQENNKQLVQKEMNFEFDKKEAITKANQDKKDALSAEEKHRQKIITYSIGAGFLLVLILAIIVLKGYRQKHKANKIILEQKHLVEEKQREVMDSIRYAKRIQQALMPSNKSVHNLIKRLHKKG